MLESHLKTMVKFTWLLLLQSIDCLDIKNTFVAKITFLNNHADADFISFVNSCITTINETFYEEIINNQSTIDELKDMVNCNSSEKYFTMLDEIQSSNESYNLNTVRLTQLNLNINTSVNYFKLNEDSELIKCSTNLSACNNETANPKYYHLYPIEQWKTHHFFNEDFLKIIDPHWFNYPPPSHQAYYTFAGIYTFLMLVGFIGNGLVIFMIITFRTLRTPANILVLNLAGSDILMMIENPLFLYNSLHFGPVLGDIGCQLYGFIGGLSGTVSIMTLAAIALDRFVVIVYPFNKKLALTKDRLIIWIVFIWTYSAVFACIPLADVGVKRYVPEGFLTSCSYDYLSKEFGNRLFVFVFFVAAWCLPLLIIVLSYAGIYREVLKFSLARRGQEREKRKREIKLSFVVALVIIAWFISWTPYAVISLLGIFNYTDYITPMSSMIPAIFCKSAAGINPFIYALNHPSLRKELRRLFCKGRYTFERNQTLRSWKSMVSRDSVKIKDETFNRRKLIRRTSASSFSSQLSVKSAQVIELSAITAQTG